MRQPVLSSSSSSILLLVSQRQAFHAVPPSSLSHVSGRKALKNFVGYGSIRDVLVRIATVQRLGYFDPRQVTKPHRIAWQGEQGGTSYPLSRRYQCSVCPSTLADLPPVFAGLVS